MKRKTNEDNFQKRIKTFKDSICPKTEISMESFETLMLKEVIMTNKQELKEKIKTALTIFGCDFMFAKTRKKQIEVVEKTAEKIMAIIAEEE